MTDLTIGPNRSRLASVDLLRGIVMIIMALDHVRDYWSLTPFDPSDLSQTDGYYFFTRWITHFCAPVFVFLSGTSAWLYKGNKQASNRELSRFLFTRGLWLVIVEMTWVTMSWQFGYNILILQVIWAIGISMIALSVLVYLPRMLILFIGLAMIFGHNLLDPITPASMGEIGWLWTLVHVAGFIPLPQVDFLQGVYLGYPVVPWIGVMATGYGFGALMDQPAAERDRWLWGLGGSAVALFLLLRGFNIYGESGVAPADAQWNDHGRGAGVAVMSFLNVTKYPPSLLYLLMTLGPALLLMPSLERWRGKLADVVTVYGRVPFLFYVIHIPVIHLTSLIWNRVFFDVWGINLFNPSSWPEGFGPFLPRAYLVWVVIVVVLYWPCKWFMEYRKTHQKWWLSYV